VHHHRELVGRLDAVEVVAEKYAEPPSESGLKLCSTVNFTSSADSSPNPSWKLHAGRSLNVHVFIPLDASIRSRARGDRRRSSDRGG